MLGVKRADVVARGQDVAERLRACGSAVCYVSELAELEFLRSGVAETPAIAECRNAPGQNMLLVLFGFCFGLCVFCGV